MKDYSRILIRPQTVAQTPRHFGVNVELQEHAGRTNLWDWLADSGATAVRTFHPEVDLRVKRVKAGQWGRISGKAGFERFRRRIIADPRGGPVQWSNYKFDRNIPWMGTPDEFVARLKNIGVEPLFSLGYATKMFPRPLVRPVDHIGAVRDLQIDWEAAASAYEYYFAVIYHYAADFGGRYFMMINEPENRWGWFHMPRDIDALGKDWWAATSRGDDDRVGKRYFGILATQYGVLARLARMALEDVRVLLGKAANARHLYLSGPTTVLWEPLWQAAAEHLDALDLHHYHPSADTFDGVYSAAAELAARAGKATAITEFNRFSGGIRVDELLFSQSNSLEAAKLLMKVMSICRSGDAPLELATFYLLHFPSTHRNYKHLLYGDMNLVDWTGRDTPPRNLAPQCYPTFEQQQIRHATPAYHMFRMIARCASYGGSAGPHQVLATGLYNPTSSGPEDIHDQLGVLAVRQADKLIVSVINSTDRPAAALDVDASLIDGDYSAAVVRRCDRNNFDAVVAQHALTSPVVRLAAPARSLTQVIFTRIPLDKVKRLQLRQISATPGDLSRLELHQTTRLAATAKIARRAYDLSDVNMVWASSAPEIVRVGQGGLVQRLRNSPEPVTITARTFDGAASAEATVAGC